MFAARHRGCDNPPPTISSGGIDDRVLGLTQIDRRLALVSGQFRFGRGTPFSSKFRYTRSGLPCFRAERANSHVVAVLMV